MSAQEDAPKAQPQDLMDFDFRRLAAEGGPEALRDFLMRFRTEELRAYVRQHGLSSGSVSRLNKGDAINRIVVAARKAA